MNNHDEFAEMFDPKREADFRIELDFSQTQEFTPLAPGGYRAKVVSVEKRISKASGEPTLFWTFELLPPYAQRRVFANTSLQPQALWKLRNWLQMLGIPAEGKIQLRSQELVGRKCIVLLEEEVFQGTRRNRVSGLLPYSEESTEEGEELDFEQDIPF